MQKRPAAVTALSKLALMFAACDADASPADAGVSPPRMQRVMVPFQSDRHREALVCAEAPAVRRSGSTPSGGERNFRQRRSLNWRGLGCARLQSTTEGES